MKKLELATDRALLGYIVLMDQDVNIEFEPFIQQLSGLVNLNPFIKLTIENIFTVLYKIVDLFLCCNYNSYSWGGGED